MTLRSTVRRSRNKLYHRLLLQLYGSQPLYTTAVGDRALRFSTADRYSTIWFYSMLRHGGVHEPPVTEAMAEAARRQPRVFADVGSHLGYYSCVVAATAPDCEVVAFEMNDALIPVIERNLRLNGVAEPEVVHAAVGAERGQASYTPGAIDPGLKVRFGGSSGADTAPSWVDVISLDEFFADRPLPDLVKIDVEGAEGQVLAGATKLLQDHRPLLFLEVHPQSLEQFGSSIEEVLGAVSGAGYEIQAFDEHRSVGDSLHPVRSGADVEENMMLYCAPSRP